MARRLVALRVSIVVVLTLLCACEPSEPTPEGVSWCGEPDDLVCCPGSSGAPPGDMMMPTIAPLPEPVRAVDAATRAFVEGGGLDVAVVWRGVTDSGDAERPSRVTVEAASIGTLRFDFARAVADFPGVAEGAELRLSAAPPATWPSSVLPAVGIAIRLARADGSLLAAGAIGCDVDTSGPLPALLAPFAGRASAAVCREPAPVLSAGSWCYVGRTNYSLLLDGVAEPIAPGATARVSIGGATYDFNNHRFALQDGGGPHVSATCLPAIPPLCAFSAYEVTP